MKHLKIEFGFGVGLDADGNKIRPAFRELGIREIREGAVNLFEGCTFIRTDGDWYDRETKRLYSETGVTISILIKPGSAASLEKKIENLVKVIKRSLNQKAVYVTCYQVDAQLY